MRRNLLALGLTATLTSMGGAALAQEPASSGGAIEIGARIGYAAPFGNEGTVAGDTTDSKLSSEVSGSIPLWLDAGYRINPNLYVGLSFQYAFGFVGSSGDAACSSGISCSVSGMRLGANLHYHLAPGQSFDPWLGLGAGYEWLTLSASQGGNEGSATASGFEFANFQLGGDFTAAPNFNIGPFASFSLGQFRSFSVSGNGQSMSMDVANKALHEWLVFGVKGAFDIGI